ncbi:Tail-specific protease precursor [Stieleria bergensis]|uniref:Tail-specific protease n=2 Tax=Stieleria bergensis TaxID=2528025 RepID=A0A517T132_9BACT|nr:Tail-specific protease precursor [Planctomycetes bacterium SV_7m_r]
MPCHLPCIFSVRMLTKASAFLALSALASTGLAQETTTIPALPNGEKQRVELKPAPEDSSITRIIASRVPMLHVSRHPLDDQMSERALTLFLDRFDPLKLYFYQSDIDQFRAYKDNIDDWVKNGKLDLAFKIFERFAQRVDERVETALTLLDGDFDFSKEEFVVADGEDASYAVTPKDAEDRWRRQIKYALLELKDDDTEGEEARDLLRRRYKRLSRRFASFKSADLLEAYLTSITNAYDPHSTYMSASTLDDFNIQMGLKLQGIGAALREKDGSTVVTSVIAGGAADLDKRLKPDDVIISVGQGAEGDMVDIVEMPLKDVVNLIRGNAGTVVRLGVKVGGAGETTVYQITRAEVELAESAARGQIIEHETADGGKRKIGFISLPSFYMDMEAARENRADFRSSTADVRKILVDFKEKGVDAVVLDLSRNGGGSLVEAISLTGLFINRGPVVQVKDFNNDVQIYDDERAGTVWSGPLVILTSKFSASASEILAGAIQDYRRGIIVGDPATHGKGTVQSLIDVAERLLMMKRQNFGALKVTLQQFYLPDGASTQRDGVPADIVLPSISQKLDVGEGDLKFALPADRIPAAKHEVYSLAPESMLTDLRKKSIARIESDDEFKDLMRRVELFVKQKNDKVIPLEESAFLARRAELDSQKEKEKEAEELQDSSEVYRDTFYNREVLNIAVDYIDALRSKDLALKD